MSIKVTEQNAKRIGSAVILRALRDYKGLILWEYAPRAKGAIKPCAGCNIRELDTFFASDWFTFLAHDTNITEEAVKEHLAEYRLECVKKYAPRGFAILRHGRKVETR